MKHAAIASCLTVALACSDKASDSTPPAPGETDKRSAPATAGKTAASGGERTANTPPSAPVKPLPPDTGAHEGKHVWSVRLGGGGVEVARDMAIAPDGGLIVGGYIKGKARLGEIELKAEVADGYVARLTAEGKPEWARSFGGPGEDAVDAVAVDKDGNVIAVGSFAEDFVIGDGKLPSAGADDAYVVKFDKTGRMLWAKRFGGKDIDGCNAVTTDRDGNIFVAGTYRGSADFLGETHDSNGMAEAFAIKLSADGERIWSKSFGDIGDDHGRSVAVDSANRLVLVVEFSNSVDLGGGPVPSNGNRDVAVAKLDTDGEHVWSTSYGNDLDMVALDMALDPSDNIVITGSFDDAIELAGEKHKAIGEADVLVTKLDPNGEILWARRWGEKDEDTGVGVATDTFGNIYAIGVYWKELNLTGKPLASKGKRDGYLVKLAPDGKHLWSMSIGGKERDAVKGLAVDADGNAIVAGTFYLTMNLGGDDLVADTSDKSEGMPKSDVFVAKLSR